VITDPHAKLRDEVLNRVLNGPGESERAIRNAVADGKAVPAELHVLVDKIHRHAYKVTDEDIKRLQAKYGDDQMFEIVVSAALGASRNRLLAGMKALDEA
jgi:alkylhydroperoxidase family enzyme